MPNYLWNTFLANNSGQEILMSCSIDGTTWTHNTDIKQSSKFGPSLASFNNKLFVAFVTNNQSNQLIVCSSADGVNWTNGASTNQSSMSAPSLSIFNNKLWMAFLANNNSNDVLVCSSSDGQTWSNNTQIKGQSSKFRPSLAVFNNKLWVAFVANNNTNDVLVCSSSDGQGWSGNSPIPGQSSKASPSIAVFDNKLWVAFTANNDSNDVLVCSSPDGQSWSGDSPIPGQSTGGVDSPFLAVFDNRLYVSFVANNPGKAVVVCSSTNGTDWTNNTNTNQTSNSSPSMATSPLTNWPSPVSGLGSNSNYIFDSNCNAITGLSITMAITQDLVCNTVGDPQPGSPQKFGFSLQLNAYSPTNHTTAYQQYVISLFGTQLNAVVNNWQSLDKWIINNYSNLGTVSSSGKVPAGYVLKISLQYDSSNNVSGATYLVTDNHGNSIGSSSVSLLSIGLKQSDLAPIVAFELNLVGPANSESLILSSGSGSFGYTSGVFLTALTTEPNCVETNLVTAETANSFYGALPSTPSTTFTQGFNAFFEEPMIRKLGKLRPTLLAK